MVECLPFKEKVIGSNPIVFSVVFFILKQNFRVYLCARYAEKGCTALASAVGPLKKKKKVNWNSGILRL